MTSRLLLSLVLVAFAAPSVAAEDTPTTQESKSEKRKRLKEERAQKKLEREKRAKERRHKRRRAKRKAEQAAARAAARAAAEQAAAAKTAPPETVATSTQPTPPGDTATGEKGQAEAATPTPATPTPTTPDPSQTTTTDLLKTDLPASDTSLATDDVTTPPATAPVAELTKTAPVETAEPRKRKPGWFFALRGGPSVIDRRGFNEYKSNRQIYSTERNARVELALGHYLGRHVALGLAVGSGPYPKFDASDPFYDVVTRYEVIAAHARLDLELHAGWFVLAVGGGAAYEQAEGTFETQDPNTLAITQHTSGFKRFGMLGAARTGLQIQLGHLGIELLAEASAVKLARGTYEHGMSSPGPSDREMAYVGSALLGLRLQ